MQTEMKRELTSEVKESSSFSQSTNASYMGSSDRWGFLSGVFLPSIHASIHLSVHLSVQPPKQHQASGVCRFHAPSAQTICVFKLPFMDAHGSCTIPCFYPEQTASWGGSITIHSLFPFLPRWLMGKTGNVNRAEKSCKLNIQPKV